MKKIPNLHEFKQDSASKWPFTKTDMKLYQL
jgi:hypothetical protein